MKIDQDKLPNNLDEAVQMMLAALEPLDIQGIEKCLKDDPDLIDEHFGIGMYLRNEWNMWVDSPLTRWFIKEYKLCHADDMSAIILEAFMHAYRHKPYDPWPTVHGFEKHWQRTYGRSDALEYMIKEQQYNRDHPSEK